MLYPTSWLCTLGAVYASRETTHIRANVLEIFLKTDRQNTVLAILGEIVSLAVGLWLLSLAWDFTQYSWRVWKESPTPSIATVFSDVALVIGLGLMMVYTGWHLLGHERTLGERGNDRDRDPRPSVSSFSRRCRASRCPSAWARR